jgi:hypothetical protein
MTSKFIYPNIISEIRAVCLDHLAGLASIDDFQRMIWKGESTIVAIEENDIWRFFMTVESDIELIKFTVDEDNQLEESQKVARRVLDWLSERENGV